MASATRGWLVGLFALCTLVLLSVVPTAHAGSNELRIQGAGATFPGPLYERWVAEFQQRFPAIKISYQAIGSGGGIRAITDRTVAFGASDAPLTNKELTAIGGENAIIEIPLTAGGVVPAYNLPGVTQPIRFTGEIIADIFMGRIGRWNDARLAAINPGVNLPNTPITPAYRTDGSGTTFVFTSYLATQSESFVGTVGVGKQVAWPIGQGGRGNAGVAAIIQQTPGALGYIEQNYAAANKIAFGSVQNKEGEFVLANPASISAAGVGSVAGLSGNRLVADIWNMPGKDSYPISAFTYVILYKDLANLPDMEHAKALVQFLHWAIEDGQSLAASMEYAPLASELREKVRTALGLLTFKGAPLNTASSPAQPGAAGK